MNINNKLISTQNQKYYITYGDLKPISNFKKRKDYPLNEPT